MSLKRKMDLWSEAEAGLGSAGRIRILRHLIEHPNRQYTNYGLRMPTGLASDEISRQMQILVDLGWVEEFAREPRTYKVNMENEVVERIAEFFHKLSFF